MQQSVQKKKDSSGRVLYGGTKSSFPNTRNHSGAANQTGIPDRLKISMERRSGLPLDDVRVHYGSGKPANLGALAYTQGANVYIGPGQERHLPHELTHVIQQKLGMVRPNGSIGGLPLNDDPRLEKAADNQSLLFSGENIKTCSSYPHSGVVQRAIMTKEDFINLTASKDRGKNNGAYYHVIEELLEEYHSFRDDTPIEFRFICLKQLKSEVERWRAERKKSVRESVRRQLEEEIINECEELLFGVLDFPDQKAEAVRKRGIANLFLNEKLSFSTQITDVNKDILEILGVLEGDQKYQFMQCLFRLTPISTAEGLRKVITGASENVSKNRQFLFFPDFGDDMPKEQKPYIRAFIRRLNLLTNYIAQVADTVIPNSEPPKKYGDVFYIDSTGSDPHTGGKHALFLRSRKNGKIVSVYKPRSLQPDSLAEGSEESIFSDLNALIHDKKRKLPELPKGIKRKQLGVGVIPINSATQMEGFVNKTTNMTPKQANIYFFNAGMLEAAAQILGLIDLHHDNIMPVNQEGTFMPVIIDGECAFIRHQPTQIDRAMGQGHLSSEFLINGQSSTCLFQQNDCGFQTSFNNGFHFMKIFIQQSHDEILVILQNRLNRLGRFRFVPFATGVLGNVLKIYTSLMRDDVEQSVIDDFITDQVANGFVTDFYQYPYLDPRGDQISHRTITLTESLNSGEFFFNGLADVTIRNHHNVNFMRILHDAFREGTIPLFEINMADGRILCDAPRDNVGPAYRQSVIARIEVRNGGDLHVANMVELRDMLLQRIQEKLDHVEDLESPVT